MSDFRENWEETTLGSIFNHRKVKGNNDMELLSVTGGKGIVRRDSLERRDTSNNDKSKYLLVEKGDIVYNTMRMWQGVSGVSSYKGIVSPAYTVCSPTKKLDSRFAGYLLKDPAMILLFKKSSQGLVSDTWNLKYEKFAQIRCLLPPLSEQRKIVSILTSVDKLIETTQKQILKLQDLKKATMNELISKGIGNTDISDNELGGKTNNSDMNNFITNWSIETLSDISHRIIDGTHFSPKSKKGKNIYLTAKNIKDGKIQLDDITLISDEEHEVIYSRCDVKKGDILFTKDGTVGEVAINTLEDEFSLLSSVAVLKINNKYCLTQYVYQWLRSSIFQDIIKKRLTGTAVSRLTLEKINKLPISFPPLSEQSKITSILTTVDKLIENTKKQINQTKSLKKSLMQDLLSGSKRVNI